MEKKNEMNAYNIFLNSGKVEDYLNYVNIKKNEPQSPYRDHTGENSAYNDGWYRAT